MLYQVEFLIEGYLLPPTIGTLRVSEELLLEKVWWKDRKLWLSHEPRDYAIAYVGVGAPKEANQFTIAGEYLDFFLLIYSFVSGQPVTTTIGVSTTIDGLSFLGASRISFPSFERIHILGEQKEDFLSEPILEVRRRFL